MELTRLPFILMDIYAFSDDHLHFDGNFGAWFKHWVGMKVNTKLLNRFCWQQHNSSLLCFRISSGIDSLVLNLPIVFIVELSVGNNGISLD